MAARRVVFDPGFGLAEVGECDFECPSRLAEDDELAIDGEDDELLRGVFHFAELLGMGLLFLADVSCNAAVCCSQVHVDWASIVKACIEANVEERFSLVGAELDAVEEDLEHRLGLSF